MRRDSDRLESLCWLKRPTAHPANSPDDYSTRFVRTEITRFMERKIQQQTLSIRVPETLRNYLERARVILSDHASRDVSTSDVAKFLLESAREDRLDDRIEVADLRTHSVEGLLVIRQK